MIILGVDPGLIKTGWGIIKKINNSISYISSGTIKTKTDIPIGERLKNINYELDKIIKEYCPNEFAIEITFVNDNAVSSLKLGQARGVAILTAALNNLEVFEYSPNQIKKTVTGVGKARKEQVGMMVKCLLPAVNLKTEDEADALAIAICHCSFSNSFKNNI